MTKCAISKGNEPYRINFLTLLNYKFLLFIKVYGDIQLAQK